MDVKSIEVDKFGEPFAILEISKYDMDIITKLIFNMYLTVEQEEAASKIKQALLETEDTFLGLIESENEVFDE